jgi:hypothetical protein
MFTLSIYLSINSYNIYRYRYMQEYITSLAHRTTEDKMFHVGCLQDGELEKMVVCQIQKGRGLRNGKANGAVPVQGQRPESP